MVSHDWQDSEDTQYMAAALGKLGVRLQTDWDAKELVVHGCGGRFPVEGCELFLGNAGTAMRYRFSVVIPSLVHVAICSPVSLFFAIAMWCT